MNMQKYAKKNEKQNKLAVILGWLGFWRVAN